MRSCSNLLAPVLGLKWPKNVRHRPNATQPQRVSHEPAAPDPRPRGRAPSRSPHLELPTRSLRAGKELKQELLPDGRLPYGGPMVNDPRPARMKVATGRNSCRPPPPNET